MTVSVILPFYNSEKTLVTALESVRQQKNADAHFEVILINDGSTDRSREIAEKFISQHPDMNITLLSQENKGVAAARNAGLRVAKGDYIAFIDADDEWLAHKISRQIQVISDEKIDFLASERNNIKMKFPYCPDKKGLAKVTLQKLLFRNEIVVPSVVFRREILDAGLWFNEGQRYAEDVDYWMRISLHFNMYILSETLVIAGGGKRSFGVSGLSANLAEMDKGFRQNLISLEEMGILEPWQRGVYALFYKLKYFFLLFRQRFSI